MNHHAFGGSLVAALALLVLAGPALAQGPEEERVRFAPGASGAELTGSIQGDQIIDYLLGARAGQRISITFEPGNPSAYFNLLRGDDPAAIHIGSTSGNRYEGVLPENGDYRIRVYLMRSAARRNETAEYELEVDIAAAGGGDFADGLAGGPDEWEVYDVPANDVLNVRSGPGTGNEIVGAVGNGDRLENLGCRMEGQARWCRVGVGTEMRTTGWVNGRYLREATAATGEVRGNVPCAERAGQPTRSCPFRASRGPGGNASVWVTLSSGEERYLLFEGGTPTTAEAGRDVTWEKDADLYLIRIGEERYEVPEVVVYGG